MAANSGKWSDPVRSPAYESMPATSPLAKIRSMGINSHGNPLADQVAETPDNKLSPCFRSSRNGLDQGVAFKSPTSTAAPG